MLDFQVSFVDDRLDFVFPVIHVLELVRPAGQYVGQADLDFGTDAFDTRCHEERATDALLATATAARRRKENVRLQGRNILLDIARKRLGKTIERARGHMGHRLDAVAQAYVQVYRGKNAYRQQK